MKNQKGQSLVEALIALGAATLIISAITVAVITAVSNSDYSKYQNLATGYANQGIEIVQQKSQLDWTTTAGYTGTYCLSNSPVGTTTLTKAMKAYTCPVNIVNPDSKFVRIVEFTPDSSHCQNRDGSANTQVEVTVEWNDGKCSTGLDFCHHVVLDSCLADIYRIPTTVPTPTITP